MRNFFVHDTFDDYKSCVNTKTLKATDQSYFECSNKNWLQKDVRLLKALRLLQPLFYQKIEVIKNGISKRICCYYA